MQQNPTISFIIPCYNLAHFLEDAINSCILVQASKEIIIINDGSTDNTSETARSFPEAICIEQANQGLPAARNSGMAVASGEYICFLDADDWLIHENIMISINLLDQHTDADLVFGRHLIQHEDGKLTIHQPKITCSIYHHLLISNVIGNPSSVLYRTKVAKRFPFSTNPAFKGCEDYQQYLRIVLKHKIIYHEKPVCIYRHHSENMSKNMSMMLTSALQVLKAHRKELISSEDIKHWNIGINAWLKYYNYFPLRKNGKLHLTKYHLLLVKILGWKLPLILIQKWLSKI